MADLNDLDEVCALLGIQESFTTPAEAVRELHQEIERLRGQLSAIEEDGTDEHNAAVTLRQRVAELKLALEPFATVAEYDIGLDEADNDVFRPISQHNKAPKITVGDLRRAYAAIQTDKGDE